MGSAGIGVEDQEPGNDWIRCLFFVRIIADGGMLDALRKRSSATASFR
jgi:hypothetical protein